jgi:hypothetical protein
MLVLVLNSNRFKVDSPARLTDSDVGSTRGLLVTQCVCVTVYYCIDDGNDRHHFCFVIIHFLLMWKMMIVYV